MPDLTPRRTPHISLKDLSNQLGPEAEQLLSLAIEHSNQNNQKLWLVGGAIRDFLLEKPIRDLDIATNGDSLTLAEAIKDQWNPNEINLVSHSDLLTASLRTDANMQLDISRLRTERYIQPGALPVVSTTEEIDLDLKRRDFSINAMALGLSRDLGNTFHDPFDGISALDSAMLITLHPGSFIDDPTRLWRAARLATTHALKLDIKTYQQLHAKDVSFENVSGVRLVSELRQICASASTLRICSQLQDWKILERTDPALSFDLNNFQDSQLTTEYNLRTLATGLLMYTPKEMRLAALERLQLPKQLRIFIEEACLLLHHVDGAKFTSDSITSYEKIGEESFAIASTLNKEKTTSIANALEKWARCSSHLTAADLKQIGISTGPDIGLTLHRLKWADFIGTISSKTDAYNFLQNENIK
jgi:tRNA nucleotidyltransferase (CCA-adding enzyme)